jgi:hypothetical protein
VWLKARKAIALEMGAGLEPEAKKSLIKPPSRLEGGWFLIRQFRT